MRIEVLSVLFSIALSVQTCTPPTVSIEYVVKEVARANAVDPDLFWSMVEMESDGDPSAIGDNGAAIGLTQMHGQETFDTWGWLCCKYGHPEWADDDWRFDPTANATIGAMAVADGYGWLWASYRLLMERRK